MLLLWPKMSSPRRLRGLESHQKRHRSVAGGVGWQSTLRANAIGAPHRARPGALLRRPQVSDAWGFWLVQVAKLWTARALDRFQPLPWSLRANGCRRVMCCAVLRACLAVLRGWRCLTGIKCGFQRFIRDFPVLRTRYHATRA